VTYQDETVLAAGNGFHFCKSNTSHFHSTEYPPHLFDLAELSIFSIPDWVSRGIIYQIFPERFCNGDPSRDPDFSEWYYQDVRTPPPEGEFLQPFQEYYHLVQDWRDISGLSQSPYLPKGKPDWWSFYGGDLKGIISRLDYLVSLGITIIYFNPLWLAKSNHKYDAADYMKLDPHFGTEEELKELVALCHERGIRVILDVAFNHTGETFWAFRNCIEKGPFSDYWNWYDWHKYPLPKPLPEDFKPKEYYQCWWGIKDMPDLNYDLSRSHPEENYVTDIRRAVVNEPLVDYVLKASRWWIKEMDFDGFRLDVPDEVPFWFWELFRKEIKAIKPDAWLVGELWHNAGEWVNHKYFDSVMNYAYFKAPLIDYLISRTCDKDEFQTRILEGLTRYPMHALKAMMNLIGSHDTWRIFELASGNIDLLKITILFQMTFIGTPHIYYGDEICMQGKKDPDNRRPFNWNWVIREEAREIHDFYQKIIQFRKLHNVLVDGEFRFLEEDSELCVFERYDDLSSFIVIINASDTMHSYLTTGKWNEIFITSSGTELKTHENTSEFCIAPHTGMVISKADSLQ